ncbi:MAG: hypothetical protein AAGL11_02705 [Pseudomonadota bacterium]
MSAVRLVIFATLFALSALSSAASTVHHVRFAQLATVLVWQDDALIGQGQTVSLTGASDLAPVEMLGSGQLIGTIEATGQSQTVRIASNTGFEIRAADGVELDGVSVRVISIGANAAASTDKDAPQALYRQSSKTALRPGSPLSQSITLEIEWQGETAPRLLVAAL